MIASRSGHRRCRCADRWQAIGGAAGLLRVWTNEPLLFHMLFGCLIIRALVVVLAPADGSQARPHYDFHRRQLTLTTPA